VEDKGKDKVVPLLKEAPRREDVWGGSVLHAFLTSALDGGK